MSLFTKRKENGYKKKLCLMTDEEKAFFQCFCALLDGCGYIVQPKVPLQSVVEGKEDNTWNSKDWGFIFDFCVFDQNYQPLLLIEIENETQDNSLFESEKGRRLQYI